MLEPEPKDSDARIRSLKFEYRLHSLGTQRTCGLTGVIIALWRMLLNSGEVITRTYLLLRN